VSGATPSQTVGPFFHIGLRRLSRDDLVPSAGKWIPITISGQVLDGDRQPIPDAVIEVWQANHLGQYAIADALQRTEPAASFCGWGRLPTDASGGYKLRTIKPGQVIGSGDTLQAPHINVAVFMRGLLRHLFTRIYFENELTNTADPVLLRVPEKRRPTLIAQRCDCVEQRYSWNIVVQGPEETVFFDW
jgi:protocatechuate 3,4-dioxygenase alpha subunit